MEISEPGPTVNKAIGNELGTDSAERASGSDGRCNQAIADPEAEPELELFGGSNPSLDLHLGSSDLDAENFECRRSAT